MNTTERKGKMVFTWGISTKLRSVIKTLGNNIRSGIVIQSPYQGNKWDQRKHEGMQLWYVVYGLRFRPPRLLVRLSAGSRGIHDRTFPMLRDIIRIDLIATEV